MKYTGFKQEFHQSNLHLYQWDCMELMKQTPDKYYDLAIVDPPYGGGNHSMNNLRTGGTWASKYGKKINDWDKPPTEEYFDELFRVSKNQIVWGANYFIMPPSRCFIVMYKPFISESFTMSMCEYAWTSFDENAKLFKWNRKKIDYKDRTHPTQKPVKLYEWLLKNYAKQGDKILDTHLGSMSIAIACNNYGFELTGCEIDKDYYNDGIKRVKYHLSQLKLDFK
jgi:site-specific DNA-methyltransferase (adenine-specific)